MPDGARAVLARRAARHGLTVPVAGERLADQVGAIGGAHAQVMSAAETSIGLRVAGTTRDPVDELVQLGGRPWVFVDTAGIRRRVHQTSGADFYASLRTQAALERAEVAVVLIEANERLTEQDTRIITSVVESGRALVLVTRLVAAQIVPGLLAWMMPGELAPLLWVWWLVPLRHQRRAYGGPKG